MRDEARSLPRSPETCGEGGDGVCGHVDQAKRISGVGNKQPRKHGFGEGATAIGHQGAEKAKVIKHDADQPDDDNDARGNARLFGHRRDCVANAEESRTERQSCAE